MQQANKPIITGIPISFWGGLTKTICEKSLLKNYFKNTNVINNIETLNICNVSGFSVVFA